MYNGLSRQLPAILFSLLLLSACVFAPCPFIRTSDDSVQKEAPGSPVIKSGPVSPYGSFSGSYRFESTAIEGMVLNRTELKFLAISNTELTNLTISNTGLKNLTTSNSELASLKISNSTITNFTLINVTVGGVFFPNLTAGSLALMACAYNKSPSFVSGAPVSAMKRSSVEGPVAEKAAGECPFGFDSGVASHGSVASCAYAIGSMVVCLFGMFN